MIKVVYYARVSTEEEKQIDALRKQTEELELFINGNEEWILTDKYVDEGKSGTSTKGRTEYNRLYQDIQTNKFDIIVIKDQSRLMRNVLDWYLFMDLVNKNNKRLYFFLEHNFYTPDNAFLTGIKAMMAEEYSRDLSKKISSAAKRSQINGTVYGSNRMLGYEQHKGKMTINESEAEIVRFIFNAYVNGDGFRKIQQKLSEMNIKSSNGTDFSLSTLKRMIKNEKYKGLLVSGKRRKNFETKKMETVPENEWIYIPEGVPCIISETIWNKANDILNKKVTKQIIKDKQVYVGYFNGGYSLSGKLICGKCGKTYWHNCYTTAVSKTKKHNWQCSTYKSYGKNSEKGCDNIILKHDELMSIVKQTIFEFSSNSENAKDVISTLKMILEDSDNTNIIKNIYSKIDKLNKRKNNLLDTLLDELITKEQYLEKTKNIDDEISETKTNLVYLENKNDLENSKIDRLNGIEKYLSLQIDSAENITDEMIKSFVDKIEVFENELIIYFSTGEEITKNYEYVSSSILYRTHTQILSKKCVTSTKELSIKIIVNL